MILYYIENEKPLMPSPTLSEAAAEFADSAVSGRSPSTIKTYGRSLKKYLSVLADNGAPPTLPAAAIPDLSIGWLLDACKELSPATEQLYLVAALEFLRYLESERILRPDWPAIERLIKQRRRKVPARLPQFPAEAIEKLITAALTMRTDEATGPERLRLLRNRALILLLADSGLRISEAVSLTRGAVDWNEHKALIIGKGDRQALVRLSSRSIDALRAYLTERQPLDGATGRPLASLSLLARHSTGGRDPARKNQLKPISTNTGRQIIYDHVYLILGPAAAGTITPHSFRHRFVSEVVKSTGNIKLAQDLARHKNIQVTQRYAHLSEPDLDAAYGEIFERPS